MYTYGYVCSWHCLPTVRCRPSCFTVLLTIKLLLCILKLMHKVHAPGETHTDTFPQADTFARDSALKLFWVKMGQWHH